MTMMQDTGLTLARRLRAARLLADLEQAELAERIGTSRGSISNYERGVAEPTASLFVRWAEATGQPLEWLAEGVLCAMRDSNPQPSGWGIPIPHEGHLSLSTASNRVASAGVLILAAMLQAVRS